MSEWSGFSDSGAVAEDIDVDIDYYAALTPEQVEAELRRYGIDPRPTIDAVTRLVTTRLSRRRGRTAHGVNARIRRR